jgi:hypothetical protein
MKNAIINIEYDFILRLYRERDEALAEVEYLRGAIMNMEVSGAIFEKLRAKVLRETAAEMANGAISRECSEGFLEAINRLRALANEAEIKSRK